MKAMTKAQKQQAETDARNAAKVFEIEEGGVPGWEAVYQIFPASECYPEGRKVFVAELAPNYAGKGKPYCVYIPEPDLLLRWQGNGLTLGSFADSREHALEQVRTRYTN